MQVSALSRKEIFSTLQTGENGLDGGEVRRWLADYGPNELETTRRNNYVRRDLTRYTQFFAVLL